MAPDVGPFRSGVALVVVAATAACGGSHGSTRHQASSPDTRATTTTSGLPVPPGTTSVATLLSHGVERSYRLHVPTGASATRRRALVVVLHGANGNAARVELRYHWDPLADSDGFFVVYPQGLFDRWNLSANVGANDDVAFLAGLINDVERQFPIDPARVYVAGMSSGAGMTYLLGCALPDRIAAIAPVEGANPGCSPTRPVSMVAVHGSADHQIPLVSAQRSVAAWRGFDGCPADGRIDHAGPVTHLAWAPCARNAEVELYTIDGSGHEWPGSWPPLPGHDLPSPDLDATRVVWDFFRRQQLS